jgi:hypothetical protein
LIKLFLYILELPLKAVDLSRQRVDGRLRVVLDRFLLLLQAANDYVISGSKAIFPSLETLGKSDGSVLAFVVHLVHLLSHGFVLPNHVHRESCQRRTVNQYV